MACCGGFACSKNSLVSLNLLYMVIAFVLIGVAAYARIMDHMNSFALLGGIIGCGVFLLLIGIMGLYGAAKHHQICLFFYMVILFLLFVVQFALAVAMLAISQTTRSDLIKTGWEHSSDVTRKDVENQLCCCGFGVDDQESLSCQKRLANDTLSSCKCSDGGVSPTTGSGFKTLNAGAGYGNKSNPSLGNKCMSCKEKLEELAASAVTTTGGVGLFFSFTEAVGVFLALRFRNMKDPLADPDAFL